ALTVTGGQLVNASGATIRAAVGVGTSSRTLNAALNNQGTLSVNQGMTINGSSIVNAVGGLINGNATLTLAGAPLTNQGTIAPGTSPGILSVSGSTPFSASGELNVEIGGLTLGTQYDRLAVSNTADLDGTLNISLINGFEPAIGDSFLVLTYGSRMDTFSTVTGQDIGNGKYLYTKYRPSHLALRVGPPPVTPSYTITASAGSNGSISPSGAVQVFQGLGQTFTITPAFGYQVDDVLVDGASVGAVTSYTFSNVTANHTIHATFAVQTFTISATAGPNGAIQPSGSVIVNGGEDQVFIIAPDAGYHVLDVLVDGVSVGPVTGYVFTSVTANHTISATFEINTYAIMASAGPGGSITPSGSVPVTHGSSQIFNITPSANYQVADVFVDAVSVGAVTQYEFTNITTGHTIQAVFAPITHTIVASAGSGGVIQPSGNIAVNQGSNFTFNISAYPGYSIADVLVDGGSVGAVSSYTFTNVLAGHTIAASFVQNTYTITAAAGLNGSIDPSGAVLVPGGASQTFNILADPGYHVADVLIDGSSAGPLTSYTFGNVAANHTIEASFAINVYNIFASAGANGSITPSGNVAVTHGNGQNFTITPDMNYSIGDVIVDGVSQGAISSYDFMNVTANHSIGAYFTPDNFSYVTLNTGVTVNIHATYFVSATVGYAVGAGGLVLITTDGGQTWSQFYIGVNVDLHSVVVIDNVIWVAGANGHICYSIDGGITWIPANPGPAQTFYSLTFVSGGYGWACGADGLIYYWNGSAWMQQVNIPGVVFYGIYAFGNYVYAVGTGGVIYFWNGVSWAALPGLTVDLYGVYFLNANFGYVVGANGTIYRTTDGGANWVQLTTGVTVIIRNIIIGDANTAWAVCEGGVILQTTDGGNTWEQIDPGCTCDLYGIAFSGGQGYVVGSGGVAYNFQSTLISGTPQFAVSPVSLDFGSVGVGYARTLTVTVSNSGDAQLDVAASSTDGNFIVNPLVASISAGGSLNFSITFNPGSAGLKSGSIQFAHNAAGSPGSVAVSGTGVETGLSFTPVNIGTTANLYGVSFLNGSYGAVVGAGGVLYITSNGGLTWTEVSLGVNVDLRAIQFIGSAAFIVGANGYIARSTDGGITWTSFTTGTGETFYASHFINAFYGFAAGSGGVIYFWNGTAWVAQSPGVNNTFYSVYAVGNTAYAVGSGGVIYRYVNGVWIAQTSGVAFDFLATAFLDVNFGYAVGANGVICQTFDGGQTWIPLSSGVTLDITAIKIFSPLAAWATCADGTLLQTLDGGATWAQAPACTCDEDLAAIDFRDCKGMVVGQSGQAYSFSTNQCTTTPSTLYTRLTTGVTQRLSGISFRDALNGCIAGYGGTVLFTNNGGLSWVSSNTGVITDLTGVRWIGNAVFITGLNGLISVSYDGGLTWIPFVTGATAHFYASSFISAGYGFAVGGGGTICLYDGVSWTPTITNTTVNFYGVYALGSTAWAVGESGTICRYVNGAWVPQTTNSSATFYDIAFINPNFGYAVGANGTIYRTRNGGASWAALVSGVNVTLRGIKIISPRVAYCLGDNGVVLETTDCGETWTQINLDVPIKLEAIEIINGQGFIAGGAGEAYSFVKPEIVNYQLFALSNDTLEVGAASVGSNSLGSVTVTNDGTAPLEITSVTSDNAVFTISPASATVSAGGSEVFEIAFNPTATGPASTTISFTHDGDCAPSLLAVNGTAISSAYTILNTGTNTRLTGVSFINPLQGCAAGYDGRVLFTGDGGSTWTPAHINCGCHLHGVKFVGNRAFFIGSGGHIYHTDDFGASYYSYTTNTTVAFYSASFINLSLGWAVGGGGTICIYNGSGWTPQVTNTTVTFYGVHAIGTTAYAVGELGTICKYVNGGWVSLTSNTNVTFYGVAFVNPKFGYAVGENGTICRTRDGGATWVALTSGVNATLRACKIISPKVAYCLGDDGVVLQTVDCGETWTQVNIDLSLILEDIDIVSGQGFIVGDLGEAFKFSNSTIQNYQLFALSSDTLEVETASVGSNQSGNITVTNDGTIDLDISSIVSDNPAFTISPANAVVGPNSSQVFQIAFAPTVTGSASASISFDHDGDCVVSSLVVNSQAVSSAYTVLNTGVSTRLTGVSFINGLQGSAGGFGGRVLYTTNGGLNWTARNINAGVNLHAIRYVGSRLFLIGSNGHICHTDNSGLNYSVYSTGTTVTFYDASFINASLGWVVGGNGTICIYNGTNWAPQTSGVTITLYGVYAIGTTAYAVGENGAVCRYVGGSWVSRNPGVSNTFYACAFVNENFGYIVGSGGIICRTRNGGLTWEPLVSGVTVDLKACKVVSPRIAYCVGDDGTVLKTEDCGDTWTPVDIELSLLLEDIEIIAGQGFIVGDLGEAFKFSNPVSFQLFALSASDLNFGSVNPGGSATQTVEVSNPGNVVLTVSAATSNDPNFTVTPGGATVAAGENATFTIQFAPGAAGTFSGKIFFQHDASCELDSVAVTGTGVEQPTACDVSGRVTANGEGLANVIVKLLDNEGLPLLAFPYSTTDDLGAYEFNDVPVDIYQVMIVEPLGYASDGNPKVVDLAATCPTVVNFALTEVVIGNEARSMGYWKHQFDVYLTGRGHAQETEAALYDYIARIHEHYTPHFDIFEDMTTFGQWQEVLSVKGNAPMWKRARQQLAATLLNFTSLKIGQYTVVTADNRTAGDVLTYVSLLLTDGTTSNDELAKNLAEKMNLQQQIGAGIVPPGNILYKGEGQGPIFWNFEGLPTEFELYVNYPNPFNPATTIRYDLPVAGEVSLSVYNILGQKVAELVHGQREAGRHAVLFDASQLASGMYIYALKAGSFSKVQKMMLLK
ncbi:MAG: choice-of-anchor D domain-containing protein, partial [Calditrichaceae bacterium]|nr:choice-of-anchor D domain-containing protein [Calditrichaceae bacterium]